MGILLDRFSKFEPFTMNCSAEWSMFAYQAMAAIVISGEQQACVRKTPFPPRLGLLNRSQK